MKKRIAILGIITIVVNVLVIACDTSTYSEIEQETNSSNSNTGSNTDTTTNTNTSTDTGNSSTTTTSVSYTNDIKPIINTNCSSCHNSSMQSPSLTTYTQVKNATNTGKLLCTIQASGCRTMPPSGKMSQANINLILLWKSQGYIQ